MVAEANALVSDSGSVSGPDPVDAYLEFISDSRATTAMAPDHEFAATAIDKLAAALEALADPTAPGVQRDLDDPAVSTTSMNASSISCRMSWNSPQSDV